MKLVAGAGGGKKVGQVVNKTRRSWERDAFECVSVIQGRPESGLAQSAQKQSVGGSAHVEYMVAQFANEKQ